MVAYGARARTISGLWEVRTARVVSGVTRTVFGRRFSKAPTVATCTTFMGSVQTWLSAHWDIHPIISMSLMDPLGYNRGLSRTMPISKLTVAPSGGHHLTTFMLAGATVSIIPLMVARVGPICPFPLRLGISPVFGAPLTVIFMRVELTAVFTTTTAPHGPNWIQAIIPSMILSWTCGATEIRSMCSLEASQVSSTTKGTFLLLRPHLPLLPHLARVYLHRPPLRPPLPSATTVSRAR